METDEYRSTSTAPHRSTEEVASCATVRILTHEEFTAKHPHLPKPYALRGRISIDIMSQLTIDIQTLSTIDTTHPESIDDHLLPT
ncbi:hypothetical protein DY000_02031424 [Brassica cretica]|uniref:Uncharacterized protein n=1 Tax=Brassica cretica TaxID=69181 RepID=A0ABQ7DHJ1_BRACR|nr:hypothetical protein DY000_02031424 [Brassica cretica]